MEHSETVFSWVGCILRCKFHITSHLGQDFFLKNVARATMPMAFQGISGVAEELSPPADEATWG